MKVRRDYSTFRERAATVFLEDFILNATTGDAVTISKATGIDQQRLYRWAIKDQSELTDAEVDAVHGIMCRLKYQHEMVQPQLSLLDVAALPGAGDPYNRTAALG